ncbi:MAG: bestrophin family protein [bacterium]
MPIVLGIVFVVEFVNDFAVFDRATFSYAVVGLLASSISIFLAFRVNESYARWWEARSCWENIKVGSRVFARKALTLIDSAADGVTNPEVLKLRQKLVYRQIAYIHALRLLLREQEHWEELKPFLNDEDYAAVLAVRNKPLWLAQRQAQDLVLARDKGWVTDSGLNQFDRTQRTIDSATGSCERIKNTPVPINVTGATRLIAWGMAIVLPMVILDSSNKFDLIDMVVVPILMFIFLIIERLGRELQYPFDNDVNDTPMTAICRSAEIDLRQMLNEESLPSEIEAEHGVLM